MTMPMLVLLGDFADERIAWDRAVNHVGWSVGAASSLDRLGSISQGNDVPAVFVDCHVQGRSCVTLVKRVKSVLPRTRVVLCCPIDRAQYIDSEETGAFDVLARPLKIEEVRRCIGFLWKAWTQQAPKVRVAYIA